jgi:hypothetical protein
VTVTATGCAGCPTPTVPNGTTAAGVVKIPGGSAPVPLKDVVAGAIPGLPDPAVIEPICAPPVVGTNCTPAWQLAPPLNVVPQVVIVGSSANPEVTTSCSPVIPDCPEFVKVTVSVALV